MAKVRNNGRRWVGEDGGAGLTIESGETAEVSEALAEVLVPGCGFELVEDDK